TGLSQPGEFGARQSQAAQSAVATGNLDLSLRLSPQAIIAYDFDQLSYLSSGASDRSLQQHALGASLEIRAGWLRLGGSLGAQLAFVGASAFRGLQAAGGGSGWVLFDETDATSTRVDLGFSRKAGLSEFSYLSGNRLETGLSQELHVGAIRLAGGYWLRDEDIGKLNQTGPGPGPPVLPLGYVGPTAWG